VINQSIFTYIFLTKLEFYMSTNLSLTDKNIEIAKLNVMIESQSFLLIY
jgi:hypothetical protein